MRPFGREKNEVGRFNHAGYICPMHNYEPRTLELQDSGSFASAWLREGFWSDMSGERVGDYTSQQIPICGLSGTCVG